MEALNPLQFGAKDFPSGVGLLVTSANYFCLQQTLQCPQYCHLAGKKILLAGSQPRIKRRFAKSILATYPRTKKKTWTCVSAKKTRRHPCLITAQAKNGTLIYSIKLVISSATSLALCIFFSQWFLWTRLVSTTQVRHTYHLTVCKLYVGLCEGLLSAKTACLDAQYLFLGPQNVGLNHKCDPKCSAHDTKLHTI